MPQFMVSSVLKLSRGAVLLAGGRPHLTSRVCVHGGDADQQVWPGHIFLGADHGAILSVTTTSGRTPLHYRERLGWFKFLSHLTIEVHESQSQNS